MDMDFAMFQQVINHANEEQNVSARFYDKAVKTAEVGKNGLPVFKNITYVEIRIKDNCTEIFNQPATAEKIKRFPREYALYEAAREKTREGTPLEQFAFLTAAEIETCKNRGVYTVEKLAELDFDRVRKLGLENEHIMAQMFLENAEKNKGIADFAEKERRYKDRIAALEEEVSMLSKNAVKVKNKKKKGDGE